MGKRRQSPAPGTRKQSTKRTALLLAVVMLFTCFTVPIGAVQPKEAEYPYSDLMLYVDLWQIAAVGHQEAGGYACSCFALAYARTITDGYAHDFSEYNVYGDSQYMVSAAWSLGDYYRQEYTDKSEALRDIYAELLEQRPVLAAVAGRGSTQHFVTVVGFENVTSPEDLSEENFLILDPIPAPVFSVENMGEVGYRLKTFSEGYTINNCYLLIRPFDNVPTAPVDSAVSSNYRYLTECTEYPSSAILAITENCIPYTLPCGENTALFYDCVSEGRYDYPISKGEEAEAVGLYKNTEGEYWYRLALSDGTEAFLPADSCVLTEQIPPRIVGGWFPETISGATFLEGEIHTNAQIDAVQAVVYRTGDEGGDAVISSQLVSVGEKSYSLKYSMVDYTLPFQDLKKYGRGNYTLTYEVIHCNHYVENGSLVPVTEWAVVGEYPFFYDTEESKPVTVTFDPCGGSCSVSEKTAAEGTVIGELPTAERAGYTFAGWYTAKTGGKQITSSFVVSGDMVLYARWETQTHRHAFEVSLIAPNCTEEGYLEHICACGYSFETDYVDAVGHSYNGGVCIRCREEDPSGSGEELSCDVVFTAGSAEGRPGETVRIPLKIESRAELNSFALYGFTYDTDVFELVGFENTGEMERLAFLYHFDADLGTVIIGLDTPQKLSGTVCDAVFRIKAGGSPNQQYAIGFTAMVKLDSDMLSAHVKSGCVTVPSGGTGDINCDGAVDIGDALLLYRHGMLPQLYPIDYAGSTDLNGDSLTDIRDAILLFRHSMLPDLYPLS